MRLVVAFLLPAPLLFPAHAAAAVFVELNPSTVRAGEQVTLRASCDDNLKAATVVADPIGSVAVEPEFGFLTATAKVPAGQPAGEYRVTLRCPDGETASTSMHVLAKVDPSRGPATGGGGTAPERTVSWLVGGGLVAMLAGAGLGLASVRRRRLG
jgi:hypothetical protein